MSVWIYLTPREVELVMRPVTTAGENADLLRAIQAKTDRVRKEVTLSGSDVVRVRAAARNWRLGYEQQFLALDAAINRHV